MPLLDQDFRLLPEGSFGRWDGMFVAWYSLNNLEGDAPIVRELTASRLSVMGDYAYSHIATGSGKGSIRIDLTLYDDTSGLFQVAITGDFATFQFNDIVSIFRERQSPEHVDYRFGERFLLSTFGASLRWYPGFQLLGPGFTLAFESLGRLPASAPDDPRNADPRTPPGT